MTLVTSGGDKEITVEITRKREEKMRGLMFRTSLADDQGMIFYYDQPQDVTMWMRNTYISLDMVFIKADGTIHRIEVRTEPCRNASFRPKATWWLAWELAAALQSGWAQGRR